MPGTTTNFSWPFPTGTDSPPNVASDMQSLASAIDTSMGAMLLGLGVVKQVTENLPPSTTTLQNDDELRRTFRVNSLYEIRASIIHNSNSTADFKFAFAETSAGGVTGYFDVVAIPAGGAALTIQSGAVGAVFTGEGAAANRAMLVSGWLNVGVNAGDLIVQWAQNTSNASTTQVVAGSYLFMRKLT